MRFFKYLVFFILSSLSINSFAGTVYYILDTAYGFNKDKTFSSQSSACSAYASAYNAVNTSYKLAENGFDTSACIFIFKTAQGTVINSGHRVSLSSMTQCPMKGWPAPAYLPKGTTKIPIRLCNQGCTLEGSGLTIDTNNYVMTPMSYTGDSVDCTERYANEPQQCDESDPYGDCFVPPDDDCVRLKDGSITCPNNQPPPIKPTCGGADYCESPPEGCGEGYVSGSFNGQQLCVKSGPSTPPDPEDPEPEQPNQCTATYCPKPDDNKDCPTGYYSTVYNGQNICVKNNPTPNQPNPNDPNNNDQPPASEPSTGDGGTGDGSGLDLKPVIDAIKALRDSLLSALDGISKKLSSLVDGQKESNEHLKVIKNEASKTNEKLDTANGHLQKIEESTTATSEAIGETNKKLDSIKGSIDSQTKCKDSNGYHNCTQEELNNSLGNSNSEIPTRQLDERSFLTNLILVNAAYCPQDKQINWDTPFGTINRTVSFQDLCEQSAWFGYIVLALAYLYAAHIVVRA